jgi:hypothetical protein
MRLRNRAGRFVNLGVAATLTIAWRSGLFPSLRGAKRRGNPQGHKRRLGGFVARAPRNDGERGGVPYSHFFHLKNRYGSAAANTIMTSAIG